MDFKESGRIFRENLREFLSSTFLKSDKMNPYGPNFQKIGFLYTRSTYGPLIFHYLSYSKCKAQSIIWLGLISDMSSNDMSCDDVSSSDTSLGATSSFSIKWHVWYNRYYVSILSSFLMKCHQMCNNPLLLVQKLWSLL